MLGITPAEFAILILYLNTGTIHADAIIMTALAACPDIIGALG
jgi:hypothetical protein